MALYIATDTPVPTTPWREGESVFVVQELNQREEGVRTQFSKPAIRYLGAHTGCSCGFGYGDTTASTDDERRDEEMGRQSVAALRRFLVQHVAEGRDAELYACWEGDEEATPAQRLKVAPSHFSGETFELPEKVFYLVSGAA